MFNVSLLDPTYIVSMKIFLKSMAKTWHAIPRKIPDSEKSAYFVDQLRAAVYSQVYPYL
jgi:hypothetical protein